ncbi:sigma-70 family RNA polymerase sigma factor [Streptomyces sp. NPDC046977]|uniref:sigma-70 family RNA polymerase sigma factor n=1 Tax=Streptomyces sp. NPDC046977 TaxID=3154703 RepID=UPI0033F8B235
MQKTFLRAWMHLDRLYMSSGSVMSWLRTVARNLAIDQSRRAAVRNEYVENTRAYAERQQDRFECVFEAIEAVSLMQNLSREHCAVLFHTQLNGRTMRETAAILRIPVGTVKSRSSHALSNLRRLAME